jgi:hypothetical protein
MLLTSQHMCVSTGTASKGNLVRLGPFQRAHWSPGPPRSVGDTGGFNHAAMSSSACFARNFPVACPKGMDRRKARMTDDAGNCSQNATIHRTQSLQAAGEVRILGCWKYFERYSEKGRVPVVRTRSAFGFQSARASAIPERSCCVESNFCSVRFSQFFSTRVPVFGFIRPSGYSERCNMTGNEDNVGFLATGSGVQQFQLSFGGALSSGAVASPRDGGKPATQAK